MGYIQSTSNSTDTPLTNVTNAAFGSDLAVGNCIVVIAEFANHAWGTQVGAAHISDTQLNTYELIQVLNWTAVFGPPDHQISAWITRDVAAGPNTVIFGYSEWLPGHAYAVNTIIDTISGTLQKCTTAGISGVAEPSWNTSGGNTSDGSVVWLDVLVSGTQWIAVTAAEIGGLGSGSDPIVQDSDQAHATGFGGSPDPVTVTVDDHSSTSYELTQTLPATNAGEYGAVSLYGNSANFIVYYQGSVPQIDAQPTIAPTTLGALVLENSSARVQLYGVAQALSIECDDPPAGTVDLAYSHTFPASGGTEPYTFAITSGSLPTGLTLDTATGIVSGTPSVEGLFPFTIQVTDDLGETADVGCSITISELTISCNNPPEGSVGAPYSHQFVANGGTEPYSYVISAGELPPGLTLDGSAGLATGIPTTAGGFSFTVKVTDNNDVESTVSCSISILGVSCNNPPGGVILEAYTHTFTAVGGTEPYTFAISDGTFPAGLVLDAATGEVSGIPTAVSVYTFTVQVTDALGTIATVTCSITISAHTDGVMVHYWEEVPEGIEPRILMGTPRGLLVQVDGSGSDNGFDLRATIRTPSFDMGDPRALKLFMDSMTDNNAAGGIGVTAGFNNFDVTFGIGSMVQNTREQTLLQISTVFPDGPRASDPAGLVLYRNIALEYEFGTGSVLYEAEPSYFLQPFTSKFYTTQLLTSGIPGWKQLRYLRFAIISVADVRFQILNDDDVMVTDIVIPTTGGSLRNSFVQLPHAAKGRMLRYSASSDSEFVLFVEDTSVRIKKWGGPQFVEVRPFLQ